MKYKKVFIVWLLTLGGCSTVAKQHQGPYHPGLTDYTSAYSAVKDIYPDCLRHVMLCYRHACGHIIRFPAAYPASAADYRYSFGPAGAYTHCHCCMVNPSEAGDSFFSAIFAYPASAVCPVAIQASVTSCPPFCFICCPCLS